jgi:hypothetical protein
LHLTKDQKKRFHEQAKKIRRQRDALVRDLRNRPCADCQGVYPSDAMEFDHVPGRGGKLGAVGSRPSIRAVLEEARKCDVVCANCHRVRTQRRRRDAVQAKKERGSWLSGLALAVEREREALRAAALDDA